MSRDALLWDNARTMSGVLGWLYRKLGSFYPAAFMTVELQSAFLVTAGTIFLYSFYYGALADDYLPILGIAMCLTALAIAINLVRTYPILRPIRDWIEGDRSPEATAAAWATAVSLPVEVIRRDFWLPLGIVALPSIVATILIADLSWLAFFPLATGSTVAVAYAGILHYLAMERGMRPVLVDINSQVAPRTQIRRSVFSMRRRLMAALPLVTIITGFVIAGLTSDGAEGVNLQLDFVIAISLATAIALELGVLLSNTMLGPLSDLQRATEALHRGDYSASVPVTTGDELGELAASFNEMVQGLAERERIREAFGTYLDREVAEYILSEGFAEEGVEVEVSILFCDVVDFTAFASTSNAREVVACLNQLFETAVPILARHGGHVDKFEGDGLMAVFGAPEPFADHAERATRAAIEIAQAVNDGTVAGPLRIGIGVNSGAVVAGAIGGGGRLNFSVIGDAVNVAARVEEATRKTYDDVLVSKETRGRLGDGFSLIARGPLELKGVAEPLDVYVPKERLGALGGDTFPVPGGTLGSDGGEGLGRAVQSDPGGGSRSRAPG